MHQEKNLRWAIKNLKFLFGFGASEIWTHQIPYLSQIDTLKFLAIELKQFKLSKKIIGNFIAQRRKRQRIKQTKIAMKTARK